MAKKYSKNKENFEIKGFQAKVYDRAVVKGIVSGFGYFGYLMALLFLSERLINT